MTKKPLLPDRIDAALQGRPMSFYDLAMALYTDPRSHRHQQNGGPPGCYMALSNGLSRGGFRTRERDGLPGPGNRIVYPRAAR